MTAKRILVIDDNAHTLLIVGRALEKAGFEVQTTASGEEALEQI
ncbi:MAG: response regulator, partial [Aliifodinibius sp.]|nr:response regulator [Fodinibius sp.]